MRAVEVTRLLPGTMEVLVNGPGPLDYHRWTRSISQADGETREVLSVLSPDGSTQSVVLLTTRGANNALLRVSRADGTAARIQVSLAVTGAKQNSRIVSATLDSDSERRVLEFELASEWRQFEDGLFQGPFARIYLEVLRSAEQLALQSLNALSRGGFVPAVFGCRCFCSRLTALMPIFLCVDEAYPDNCVCTACHGGVFWIESCSFSLICLQECGTFDTYVPDPGIIASLTQSCPPLVR